MNPVPPPGAGFLLFHATMRDHLIQSGESLPEAPQMHVATMPLTYALVAPVDNVAIGAFHTGNDLLFRYTGGQQDQSACAAYIEGVVDTFQGFGLVFKEPPCPPAGAGITSKQLQDAVIKALQKDPASRNTAAFAVIISAVAGNWNCVSK
jgi:hypothetical protein